MWNNEFHWKRHPENKATVNFHFREKEIQMLTIEIKIITNKATVNFHFREKEIQILSFSLTILHFKKITVKK